MSDSKSKTIDDLFQAASDEGTLSPASARVLRIIDPGAQIQAAMGVKVEDVQSSEVVLVTLMPDDSGSIRFAGNAQTVREAHNGVLEALRASKQRDNGNSPTPGSRSAPSR
jgi:hypothetical protein